RTRYAVGAQQPREEPKIGERPAPAHEAGLGPREVGKSRGAVAVEQELVAFLVLGRVAQEAAQVAADARGDARAQLSRVDSYSQSTHCNKTASPRRADLLARPGKAIVMA